MNGKKIGGAVLAGLFVILYYGILLGIILLSELSASEKMPLWLFLFIIFIFSVPLIGIIMALIMRVHEIKCGEEEEAKKY